MTFGGAAACFRVVGRPSALAVDQFAQGILVAVAEVARVEGRGAALDDRLGDRDHVGVGMAVSIAELRPAHFVGAAQRAHQHAAAIRLDKHLPLAARQHDTADTDAPGLFHRLIDHAERLDRDLAVGIDKIRRVEIQRINLVALDEAVEINGLRRFDAQRLQLVVRDDDVLVPLVFVAADDVGALDLLAGFLIDELLANAGCRFSD